MTFYGNSGSNVLTGGAGRDVFADGGGAGVDTMIGKGGNDNYYVYNSADIIVENANEGYDHVFSTVSFTLPTNVEELTLVGTANLNGTGNNQGNVLTGNVGSNVLTGGTGNDTLGDGGPGGNDTMIGGAGNDTYYVNNSGDIIQEAANGGTDKVLSTVSYTLSANVETLMLLGTGNINGTGNDQGVTLYGNTGSNVLTGGAGNDAFNDGGGAGVDTMIGGAGNDSYYVNNSADTITEASNGGYDQVYATVSYALSANIETLTLLGSGAINATGNAQANIITGNSGANIIDGRGGADTLTGGAGNDIFLFDTVLNGTVATITDFSVGADMIALDRTIFQQIGASGPLVASAFETGTSAQNASRRILYNSGAGDIYYDPDGSGAQAAIRFAHVTAGTALTASSFTVLTPSP